MNVRPLLLAALALGFAAGCSKPSASSSSLPPSSEPGTANQAEPKPAAEVAAPSGDQSGTPSQPVTPPSNAGAPKAGESAVYIVRDSGVRCFAPPCPTYNAVLADKPDMDAIPIHELDLEAVTKGSDAALASLMERTRSTGLKVRGTLETRPKAGPAGDATVLRATQVD